MAKFNTWYDLLESKIFSKVANYIEAENEAEVFCTTDEVNVTETEFPAVWIHELEPVEQGQDLTNETVNAVLYSMQIDVYAHDKNEAKKLMRFALAEMKALRFNVTTVPLTIQLGADVYHTVSRFRRVIAGINEV